MARLAVGLGPILFACTGTGYVAPPFDPIPEPRPSDVAGVLLLVGDAGEARREAAPLLHRLRADVEHWSEALARDGAVAVAFLGDNAYPEGVRDRGSPDFAEDSARLHAQVWTLEGPAALSYGARGVFVPGNHDWGNLKGQPGLNRLRNMERLLGRFAASGTRVALVPEAGDPGPSVIDLGSFARLVALDTHWWLQAGQDPRKADMLNQVSSALARADGRATVVIAHHPYVSGGPHAGRRTPLTPYWLLNRTGSLVQDLNSSPYRELREGLGDVFENVGRPAVFAAGHDHSLQVLGGVSARDPEWTLVSGAGSHVTPVADAPGLVWTEDVAGYMRLVFGVDGGIDLYVVAAPADVLECRVDDVDPAACVREGLAAFRTHYSARLR